MSPLMNVLIYTSATAVIAFLSWIATKNEIRKLNSLIKEYERINGISPEQEVNQLIKKIEKQQMNVSGGKFAILAAMAMSLFAIISFFR